MVVIIVNTNAVLKIAKCCTYVVPEIKKPKRKLRLSLVYSRWESNPHFRRNWILNPARLPVPPLEHFFEQLLQSDTLGALFKGLIFLGAYLNRIHTFLLRVGKSKKYISIFLKISTYFLFVLK
jgi:hypothetical protein